MGVIREDWVEFERIAPLRRRLRNAIVGGPFGSDLVSKDYAPLAHGVPVIRGHQYERPVGFARAP